MASKSTNLPSPNCRAPANRRNSWPSSESTRQPSRKRSNPWPDSRCLTAMKMARARGIFGIVDWHPAVRQGVGVFTRVAIGFLLIALIVPAFADAVRCRICEKAIEGKYFQVEDKVRGGKVD